VRTRILSSFNKEWGSSRGRTSKPFNKDWGSSRGRTLSQKKSKIQLGEVFYQSLGDEQFNNLLKNTTTAKLCLRSYF